MRFVIRRALEVKRKADMNAMLEPIIEETIMLNNEETNSVLSRRSRLKKCCRIK